MSPALLANVSLRLVCQWALMASLLVCIHELGHLVTTWAWGGRITGLVFRGVAVGVRVDITAIAPAHKAWTVAAGLLAETGAAGLGCLVHPSLAWPVCWGCSLLANGIPWWSANDASRWIALRRAPYDVP